MLRSVGQGLAKSARSLVASTPASAPLLSLSQKRFKPLQPLKWPNDKLMRKGTARLNEPWHVRNDPDEIKGHFGLVLLKGGHLTERQIENAMLSFKNRIRLKDYDITVKDNVQLLPMTRRPAGARQGKGIGDNIQWVLKMRAGTVLFDVKMRYPAVITDQFLTEFFGPVQHMLGVMTAPQRRGLVNMLDDLTHDSAIHYMDARYHRRMQDAAPDIKHLMHYRHNAHHAPDAPYFNHRNPTRSWFPVYSGNDFTHRKAKWAHPHDR
eukprot:Rhum_TRINITY_DN15753_c0_g1::Rhum_TRINITY_DN15753_c0_g1_i1::g.162022::m.162022